MLGNELRNYSKLKTLLFLKIADETCLEYRPSVHFPLQHTRLTADHTVRCTCENIFFTFNFFRENIWLYDVYANNNCFEIINALITVALR